MTITRIKPGGWGYAEVLTSTQLNAMDANTENALDKIVGHTDTLASNVTITGTTVVSGVFTFNNTVNVTSNIAGKIKLPIKTATAAYTTDTTTDDYMILLDVNGAARILTLPSAVVNGRVLWIKGVADMTTNTLTLARAGGTGSIAGVATDYIMDGITQGIVITCYGGDWFIIGAC